MEKQLTIGDIEKIFPELAEIKDKELEKKCKEAFLLAYKEGNWTKENFNRLPVSIKNVKTKELNKQIEHIKAVTKIAMQMYDTLEDIYKQKTEIRDYVIVGALLHDVGKMIEFCINGNEIEYSSSANIIRHPLGGAIIASKVGLPDEIVHIIATHSFEGKESYHSLASIIVNMADEMAFKYITFFNK